MSGWVVDGERMSDEELRETSVDIAAKMVAPSTAVVVVALDKVFYLADSIAHYIRTGEHEKAEES